MGAPNLETDDQRQAAALIGQRVGKYQITRAIGHGGMGMVFEVIHESLGQRAAVKVLHQQFSTNPELVKRFFNEARAASIVQHPGLVKIFDFGQLGGGTVYILMEYVEGELLKDRIQQRGDRLSVGEAVRITRQLASALGAAHAKGIVHRDLKPGNIIIVPDPELASRERVKLLDFGVAKFLHGSGAFEGDDSDLKTGTGMLLGTPRYMAPEQCRGAGGVDHRADVYSLGIMFYQMLGGTTPFVAKGAGDLIAMHITKPPPPLRNLLPTVPPLIEELVHRMLEKEPADRPSMNDVVQQLEEQEAVLPREPVRPALLTLPPAATLPLQRATDTPATVASTPTPSMQRRAEVVASATPAPISNTGVPAARSARSLTLVVVLALVAIGGGLLWWRLMRSPSPTTTPIVTPTPPTVSPPTPTPAPQPAVVTPPATPTTPATVTPTPTPPATVTTSPATAVKKGATKKRSHAKDKSDESVPVWR